MALTGVKPVSLKIDLAKCTVDVSAFMYAERYVI